MKYSKQAGRVGIQLTDDGARLHNYGLGVKVTCLAGFNDSCETVEISMSVEELHDLRHLIDRAIFHAEITQP